VVHDRRHVVDRPRFAVGRVLHALRGRDAEDQHLRPPRAARPQRAQVPEQLGLLAADRDPPVQQQVRVHRLAVQVHDRRVVVPVVAASVAAGRAGQRHRRVVP
jgi:hypothetical protein